MTAFPCQLQWFLPFQLTSSRRGWLITWLFPIICFKFQLTSSRRGWLRSAWTIWGRWTISTHILTKRMTYLSAPTTVIFNHFNSHPHEEDDRCYFLAMSDMCSISTHILTKRMTIELEGTDELGGISTHILTKRMTALFSKRTTRFIYFNSHPHEEDDSKRIFLLKKGVKFQLTSSRRGWLFRIVCLNHVTDISTHILTKRMTCPPAYEM